MKVLVVGATGELGTEIIKQLKAKGHTVRAFVRKPSLAVDALGVEVAVGDLLQPGTFPAALAGVDAVVTTASSIKSDKKITAVDGTGTLALVEAAKQQKVGTFVHVSASVGRESDKTPLMRAKRQVEAAVEASGMKWAVMQPSMFMEVWLGAFFGWSKAKGTAQVFGAGDQLLAYIATRDVAAFTVACIERPPNRKVPLGGPRALSQNDAVAALSAVAKKPVKVKRVPAAVFKIMRVVAGPFSEFFATVSGLTLQAVAGDQIPDMDKVSAEFSVPLTTVEDHFSRLE